MNNPKKRWYLYILKLEDSKYYVGITSKTPKVRMHEHLNGVRAAYWTSKHKPIEIILEEDLGVVTKSHAERYENQITRNLMKERGINNVRGGDLTSTEKYIKRFGYFWLEDIWNVITYIILLLIIIIYLVIDRVRIGF